MICLVENELPLKYVTGEEPTSGRLLSWWEAYRGNGFARFFQTENNGCIGILDSQAIVCAPACDTEEIRAFLEMQPFLQKIYTTIPDVSGGKVVRFTAMRAQHTPQKGEITTPQLQALYGFLRCYFSDLPPFEPWYLDVSYRARHGMGRQTVITENDAIISSAMTVAEWGSGALIGGVATAPEHRRLGYAAQCVNALTAALQEENKTVWICPYNESAHRLYIELGFVDHTVVTAIERM